MTLDEIDQVFDAAPGMRVVGELKFDESGVDPVGLRQINLDLMEQTVPGINNVTVHIRPYTFIAWAAWRAAQECRRAGVDDRAVADDLMERYEAMYAWSHYVKGRPFRGAVNIQKIIAHRPASEPFRFEGDDWEAYKRVRTGFMSPTEYGPSIKALCYIRPDTGTYADEAMNAIADFDARVNEVIDPALLAVDPPSVTAGEIAGLAEKLDVSDPSPAEKEVFLKLFYEVGSDRRASGNMKRRKATIDLVTAILAEEGPLDPDDIRRRYAEGVIPAAVTGDKAEVMVTSALLCQLQTRQLQRLASESLLLWLERLLAGSPGGGRLPVSVETVLKKAHEAAIADPIYSKSATVGEFIGAVYNSAGNIGWPAASSRGENDVVTLLRELGQAERTDVTSIPALAARAFAIVKAVSDSTREVVDELDVAASVDSRADRLPMSMIARRLQILSDSPIADLWKEVLEGWIVGQHVHWSAVRGGDGKKRLRIGLEDNGWMLVRSPMAGVFNPTPDRLETMMSLGRECGIFEVDDDGRFSRKSESFGWPRNH